MKKKKRSGINYLLPAVILMAVVMLYPLIYTISTGFFENTLFSDGLKFIGFGQFQKLFTDKVFLQSIGNTFAWTIGSVVFQFLFGFGLAMLLHQEFVKGKTFIRILLMIPWVLPSIIGSAVWKWMYNADYGIINYILKTIRLITHNQTWLSSADTAMIAIIFVNVWKMFPFVLLMIEAALQGVQESLKEAAVIDGANKLAIFRNVTWPAIKMQCYTLILLLTIWTLNAFTFIYNLTGGGPAHKTEVMSMFIYKKAFTEYNFGLASAASTILFILSVLISLFYLRMTKKGADE